MSIRAKFVVEQAVMDGNSNETLTARAVTTGSAENLQWSKYTPSGSLTMTISNPSAQGHFKAGQEFFLILSET